MNNDLISREYVEVIVEELENICQNAPEEVLNLLSKVKNAPPVLFPLTVMINDKLTDEDIELLKRQMKDYKPQVLNLEIERPQGKWIPVSERLPEEKINPYTTDFDEVLCTTDWGDVQAFKFGTPIIHHKPHFWLGGAIMDEHIIAWQYKPEPYKEGGAENE